MNLQGIKNQLNELESRTGIIILPNGALMPSSGPIKLMVKMCRIERDYDSQPLLSDFDAEDQDLIKGLAKWQPDLIHDGALAMFLADQSKKIIIRSNRYFLNSILVRSSVLKFPGKRLILPVLSTG